MKGGVVNPPHVHSGQHSCFCGNLMVPSGSLPATAPATGLHCVQIPVVQVGTSHVDGEVCRAGWWRGGHCPLSKLPQVLCPVPAILITPASLFFPACLTASVQALAFVRTDVSGLWHCVTLCLVPSAWSIFPASLGGAHGMCLCPAKACLGFSCVGWRHLRLPKLKVSQLLVFTLSPSLPRPSYKLSLDCSGHAF